MHPTMLGMALAAEKPVRVAHIRGRVRACVCVCVCAAAELADVTATMLVMVVADAEPVRVAHIRGSPAACMCVCVWRRRRQQTSCLRADCRLLLWLTLLGCIADLAGAAPSLQLGT